MKLSVSVPDEQWRWCIEVAGKNKPSAIVQAALEVAIKDIEGFTAAYDRIVTRPKSKSTYKELVKRVEMLEAMLILADAEKGAPVE